MKAQYYLYLGGVNVLRAIGVDYSRLNKQTGRWVRDNDLIGAITGYDGDASTHEITLQEAQRWVETHHPDLSVEWL